MTPPHEVTTSSVRSSSMSSSASASSVAESVAESVAAASPSVASSTVRVQSGRSVVFDLVDLDTGVLFREHQPVACFASRIDSMIAGRRAWIGVGRPVLRSRSLQRDLQDGTLS
jgi:hypothetical protein